MHKNIEKKAKIRENNTMQDRTTNEQTTTVDEIPDRTRSSSVGNEDIKEDGSRK